jgi:hypothetical protein
MHFGGDEGHLLTDDICVTGVSRAARRLQHPAIGWREGVPAGVAGAFGARPRRK